MTRYRRRTAHRSRRDDPTSDQRPRIVVVGGGFAGFYATRSLHRLVRDQARVTLVSPADFLLYSPLLPEVATGVLDPRDIAVPLRQALPGVHQLYGHVTAVDLDSRTVRISPRDSAPHDLAWDRLVLAPGSVTREFDIPGMPEHAHGLKTLPEATFLRNHVLAQLDRADALPDTDAGRREREELLTVVAVGAGYTGTEFVAQTQHWVRGIASRWTTVDPADVRWLLVDVATQVLPELGPRLGRAALKILQRRGVEVRLGVTVSAATGTSVTLTDGTVVATRTLVWSAGVAPSPLIAALGLPTSRGRLVVDADLSVPGHTGLWAAGDAAAVPDLAGMTTADGQVPVTAPTAQHAQRQGVVVARNVAASLGIGSSKRYRHRDLGLVADFGGTAAAARPLGIPLTGPAAKVVARGYHLYALPTIPARIRVATDWLYASILPTRVVQLDTVRAEDAVIRSAQSTGIYADT
jgi:NADH dehydrogenase